MDTKKVIIKITKTFEYPKACLPEKDHILYAEDEARAEFCNYIADGEFHIDDFEIQSEENDIYIPKTNLKGENSKFYNFFFKEELMSKFKKEEVSKENFPEWYTNYGKLSMKGQLEVSRIQITVEKKINSILRERKYNNYFKEEDKLAKKNKVEPIGFKDPIAEYLDIPPGFLQPEDIALPR